MKLKFVLIVAALAVTACSTQSEQAANSVLNDADDSSMTIDDVQSGKIDLVKYNIYQDSGAPMILEIDRGTEEGCWRSAKWTVKKLDNGDFYVTISRLLHPRIVCSPSNVKKHKLGTKIDIESDPKGFQGFAVYVQRPKVPKVKRSFSVEMLDLTANEAEVEESKVQAESHYISTRATKGFTAYIGIERIKACWDPYTYTVSEISDDTMLVQKHIAPAPAIPCTSQMKRKIDLGTKIKVKGQGRRTSKNIVVANESQDGMLPKVTASDN